MRSGRGKWTRDTSDQRVEGRGSRDGAAAVAATVFDGFEGAGAGGGRLSCLENHKVIERLKCLSISIKY